ncbi:unnamed protein product, partial [Schistosoma curassoni]|uniref:V-SNARE coiled-coil homology domain-containing protein n=1 Tax=Schistosoma curassoni TaxID=6186 RepID=A0A183JV48_9TREM
VLDRKNHPHKKWISIEILDNIQERKNRKTSIDNSRTRAEKFNAQAQSNMKVESNIRADKQKCTEDLATTADKAAEGNMKQLYDTTKKLSEKYSKPETSQEQRRQANH